MEQRGGDLTGRLRDRLFDPEVLVRINAFFLTYFGWIAFGLLYGFLGRWSVNVTRDLLRLPFTSRSFVVGLVGFTRHVPPLYYLFNSVYYLGFAGSIALVVFYLLVYLRDLESSDRLLGMYLIGYTVAGAIYLIFHVYAPHVVYNLPGYSSENTLLTRQEFVFPSLHNTFITINIIALWKYRDRLGGKLLILVNSLVPFATLFLGHHWIYDIVGGIILGTLVSQLPAKWDLKTSKWLYRMELSSLQTVTAINLILVLLILILAVMPERAVELPRSLLGNT